MNPKQTIKELHRIASTLNNSKQPNKNLVLNELNKLVYRIASDEINNDTRYELDENGNKIWRNSAGQLHRTDGPAVEYANGSKEWWFNGQLHRTDGPAVEYVNGSKEWCINGKLHRTDGPAVEYASGDKEWCINGQRHRADGPAIERADGTKEWWFKDKKISEEEYNSNEF
jgi:hypothetical protein